MDHSSTNLRKYESKNKLKQLCIKNFQKQLVSLVKECAPKSILDVGCGEAFNSSAILNEIDAAYTGIDLDAGAVELAQKRVPQGTFKTGSIYELPFEENSFDLVLCNEVLEHIDNPTAGLKELFRVSSGPVILSVPHEPWFRLGNLLSLTNVFRLGNPEEHINHWSANSFAKEFAEVFTISKQALPFPWILTLVKQKKD